MAGQGIANVFIVIPQFIMSGLSSIVFTILEPDVSVFSGDHPGKIMPLNGTSATGLSLNAVQTLLRRQEDIVAAKEDLNSIAIIFQ